jgi:pantoate--beta-alanine ligase
VKTATTILEVRGWRHEIRQDVGFVPTMGFLHAGHISLVSRAREQNARVVASLFVNPKQFGPLEDFASYPRDMEHDRALLEEAGCDLLFVPSVDEMYPETSETTVELGSVTEPLEGERRPGHFRGVATVVLKLFGIVEPTRAYFGQKDAQQLAVIRKMVRDLNVPVEIHGCPTLREPDGLALSSRNTYLSPEERSAASVLFRALSEAKALWASGEPDAEILRAKMRHVLEEEPLARADYVSVADPRTFQELERADGPAILCLAVFIGRARLIDNVLLERA